MQGILKYLLLLVGFLAAFVAVYWFVQATLLPVADVPQQTVQVLYNIHGAIWTLVAVMGFGFAGLLARAEAPAKSVRAEIRREEPVAAPVPRLREPRPAAGREARAAGGRERLEPRL